MDSGDMVAWQLVVLAMLSTKGNPGAGSRLWTFADDIGSKTL